MKKRFFAGVLIFIALFSGCFLDNSPKATVKKFWTAVEKNDMKALAKVATPDTVQLVLTFGSKIRGHAASLLDKKVETITEKIDGDTAVVTIIFADGEEQNFDLIKVDGKWKVDLSLGMGKK